MRKEKSHRRFHHYVCQTGPSYIRKDTVEFDSCDVYPIRKEFYAYAQTREEWEENMARFDNSALFRPDPFGVNDYAVNFSLNKKRRWEINDEIAERIEDVQDPRKNLRVSVSSHTQDVSKCGYFFCGSQRDLPCTEYHSVTRDGTTSHRKSETGKTRLRNFTHPDARHARPHNGPRPARYFEKRNKNEDSDQPVDENSKYQKIHVHYTTTSLTAKPSLHNKASHRSLKYAMIPPSDRDFKFAKNPIVDDICDKIVETEASDVCDEADFVVVDRSSLPTVVDDLSALVVNRKNTKNM